MYVSDNLRLFYELYTQDLIRVDWNKNDLGLSISRSITEDVEKQLSKSVIHSFMKYISEIMDYVTRETYEETETLKSLKEIMGNDFEKIVNEAERKACLIEQTLESLDVEFLTKRSYRDLNKILGHNVKLKFNLDSDKSFNVELEEDQLKRLSESLLSALEKLNEINS